MCGIVGITGSPDAVGVILDGLRRLEYRGYDSAGLVVSSGNGLRSCKRPGKIAQLEAGLRRRPLRGTCGIGHTRWATHGPPTQDNAHPHFSCDRRIAVVHNGIIENHDELRRRLARAGHAFVSGTDTEAVAHLLEALYDGDPVRTLSRALERLAGAYALGILFEDHPGLLLAARHHAPLVLGLAEGRSMIASDLSVLLPHTRTAVHLEDGEIARLRNGSVEIFGPGLRRRPLRPTTIEGTPESAEKGGYPHHMLKEIHEQPQTVEAELGGRIRGDTVAFEEVSPSFLRRFRRVVVAACGTAWHAGLVAKAALEDLAGLPVEVGYASELRYGDAPLGRDTLMLAVSQSGETADTLAAARLARERGAATLALTNVRTSTLAREADTVVPMRAGLEIGVAATKTYTSQLTCVLLLSVAAGRARGTLARSKAERLLREMRGLPGMLERVLRLSPEIRNCGKKFRSGYDFMYIGRRYNLATAFEGALKMKEISYLHAEGYGAGEMKHGPLALVDDRLTTVAIAVRGRVRDKMLSNIQEIRARGGPVIAVATEGDRGVDPLSNHVFRIPVSDERLSPVTAVVPLQLLAYWTAVAKRRNVDQPRNLAKSVTVE